MDEPPSEIAVRVTPHARRAEEWATVLAATGIRHRLAPTGSGWAVVVAGSDGERAGATLQAYDDENQPEPRVPVPAVGTDSIALGVAVGVGLLGFFLLTGPRATGRSWFARGSAAAARILDGEIWRTVTALTLHADLAHALGNAVFCVVLIPPVAQALGPGTGLWVLLLAGMLGNWLTAWAHGAPHSSVGASTLTFGAIGVLAAQALVARWRLGMTRRRPWVVIVASLVLLSMLGTARGADVLAHIFGLGAGGILGLAVGLVRPHPFGRSAEWTLAVIAVAMVLGCWWVA
jgi:rhomboid protease GluP